MPTELPFCTSCGTRNDADATFCERCGHPLADTEAAPAAGGESASASEPRRRPRWLVVLVALLVFAGAAFALGAPFSAFMASLASGTGSNSGGPLAPAGDTTTAVFGDTALGDSMLVIEIPLSPPPAPSEAKQLAPGEPRKDLEDRSPVSPARPGMIVTRRDTAGTIVTTRDTSGPRPSER